VVLGFLPLEEIKSHMKKDITTSDDIKLLVDTFYEKAKADEAIGFMFNEVAKTNWEEHLPKMYGFWEILLLGKQGMTSNPMERHITINAMEKMTETHFNRWVYLWFDAMDSLFEGANVDIAKERTLAIKQTMLMRIRASENQVNPPA
jgi:hemoglobin